MKFTLGTKQNMTQVFDDKGIVHPATILSAGGLTIIQVKTKKTDGYDAVQVGFGERKEKNISKPVLGHLKKLGNFRFLREFRVEDPEKFEVGGKVELSDFIAGDLVSVSAISKGKGYQSVIKRHGFKGQPRSHGQKHSEHAPGSIGGGLRNKVPKAMRMAGRMGGDMVTIKNLTILGVDKDNGELLINGAIPGRRGTLVEVLG
jgi:large subunit ribosomal protein L3